MSLPSSDVGSGARRVGRVPLGSIELPSLAQVGTYGATHCQSISKKPAGAERTASGRAWTAPAARTSRARASTTERIVRCIRSLLSRGAARSGRHGRMGPPRRRRVAFFAWREDGWPWRYPLTSPWRDPKSDGCTLGAEEDHGHAASFSGRCPGRDPGWKDPRHPGRNAAAPLHRDLGRGGGGPCLRALVEPQATELVSHVPPGAARGDPGRWTRDPRPRHPYEERTPEGRRRPSLSGEIQDPGIDQIRP